MPYEKKRWTHRFDTVAANTSTSWSSNSWRDVERIQGVTNYIRKLKDIRAHICISAEDPTSTQGDFEDCTVMFAWLYKEQSLGSSVVSTEDSQAVWRPQIVPFISSKDFVTTTQAHRMTMRWPRITIPENYELNLVISATAKFDVALHYNVGMHWMEQRTSM